MRTPPLAEVVDVLQVVWAVNDRGLFDTESGRWALAAMETCLLDWVATAPDWMFNQPPESSAGQPGELPGQDVLPFGGEG